jgi:hypothetical protein
MFECHNCGMPPDGCVCVPWCYEHDTYRPCAECAKRPEPPIEPETLLALGILALFALILVAISALH